MKRFSITSQLLIYSRAGILLQTCKDDKINLKGLKMTYTKCEKIHKKMVTFPDFFVCETLTEILPVDTFKMKQWEKTHATTKDPCWKSHGCFVLGIKVS